MNAEIIAVGSEMLTPHRQDTNSLYLTEKLNELGIEVRYKCVVGDNAEDLTAAAKLAMKRSDIIIFMGGLGPTEDDLTREAVAEALGLKLQRDPQIIAKLEERFAKRGIKMSANNTKQADVLTGATVLPNSNGTAPGQWISGKYDGKERILILLPGPPNELKGLVEGECISRLRAKIPPQHIAVRELKIVLMPESQVDARLAPIYKTYPDVQTTILAGAGEIQLHLRSRKESQADAEARVEELAEKIEDELGDAIFSRKGESLEQIVSYLLQMRGMTLAVAESCTGGLLAQRITSLSGSSRYFLGGAVVYSNELKTQFANVPKALINKHGAVSREVAKALAEGIRQRCVSSFGIGITGVAGPTGGSEQKPVGLVYVALAGEEGTQVVERNFPGDRKRIRWFATQQALEMVRRALL
ncbi:MAG: competence/damage-inducible protein A [Acidobacteriales bacterium]|nr:competence/damage-inducible protein A [Candidatus Koribacter versatilis]MBI3645265.1 competence/damage-inducible protein A [Terriglobales bacterium]